MKLLTALIVCEGRYYAKWGGEGKTKITLGEFVRLARAHDYAPVYIEVA